MKILFLHLSDMHLKSSDKYMAERAKKMVSAIKNNILCDEIIVAVTGDIAFSGKKDEYIIAAKFFGTLVRECTAELKIRPQIYIVPGNHDLDFQGLERSRTDVAQLIQKGISTDILEKEYAKFNEFWKLAGINGCFLSGKEVDKKKIEYSGVKLQINLINSALFSTYRDKLQDGDDGCHYISSKELDILKREASVDFAITLIHHPEEYFLWDCRHELKSILLENTDILLLGHDHNSLSYELYSDSGDALITVKGGEFNNGNLINSICGFLLLDTEKKILSINQYCWQNTARIYSPMSLCEYNLDNSCQNAKDFKEWLETSEGTLISKKIDDYFVFPRLSIRISGDEEKIEKDILNLDDFNSAISEKRIIEILGSDLSGKTSLLKHIYSNYRGKYFPLMITEEDITGKIENIIRNAYERQYTCDSISYQVFLQKPKEEKIILIDDITVIPTRLHKKMLEYLLEKYDKIIYTTSFSSEFNIKKELEDLLSDGAFKLSKFKIEPFYSDKRLALIKKVCECVQQYDTTEQLENAAVQVNNFIKNQLNLFSLNPEFIIMFTRSYVLKMVENSSTNAFNAVFSNNIAIAIEKHKKKTNVQDNLIILQELAQYIHFNEKYPASLDDLKRIVEQFNKDHRTIHFYLDIKEELANAKILKVENENISFYNKTYLAYFVAKWINRKIQNGGGVEDLQRVVDNLCYNINADILLFLTYITENVGALYQILRSEVEYTRDLEEYSIDKNKITLLTEAVQDEKIKAPSDQEKINKKHQEVSRERMLFENEHIQKVNIYEENLDEFTAKEMRLIKYLELISKILPCFYHLLNVEQQDAFVSEIYKLPNKIAYYLFEPLETNKEELIDEMLEFVNNRGNTKTFDRQGVKNLLSKILTDMLLTIYDLSARCVSTDRTVIALDAFNFRQETCYYIQNIMMHENLRKFHPYVQRSDELYDTTKSLFAKYLLRRIFKKHCLDNNIEYKGNGQKYIDKYLDGQNIVGLRLTHVQKK